MNNVCFSKNNVLLLRCAAGNALGLGGPQGETYFFLGIPLATARAWAACRRPAGREAWRPGGLKPARQEHRPPYAHVPPSRDMPHRPAKPTTLTQGTTQDKLRGVTQAAQELCWW